MGVATVNKRNSAGTWALILAAGEGTRLRTLTTTPSGSAVPKQYCSLHDGPSLLQETVRRAGAVAPVSRTTVVVAEQHRRWWETSLSALPARNVIVQPANKGTANGILLPLLHILGRDPAASVVLLPSDHHVRDEQILANALRRGVEQLDRRSDETLLLGLTPEAPDPELGYIVPEDSDGSDTLRVGQFVEKPVAAQARVLMKRGALWNAFIVIATAQAMLEVFRRRVPDIVAAMRAAVRSDLQPGAEGLATWALYDRLPALDFSRDILPGEEPNLRVLPVPQCGWSDLGTPTRVAGALSCSTLSAPAPASDQPRCPYLSLATQYALQNAC